MINMSYKLPSHNVPLILVADIVVFISMCPNSTIEKICNFTGKSSSYVRSGLAIAKILGITIQQDDGLIEVTKECSSLLGRTPNIETKITVMRKYLQQWEPFILFIKFCLNDNSLNEASRKVYVLYDFQGKGPDFLKNLLLSWGTTTEIFSFDDNTLTLSKEINIKTKNISKDILSLDEDIAIRLEVANILGGESFSYLSHDEVYELIDAFKKQNKDPRGAIECAGRAFEDFLRRISIDVGIDASKAIGIGQVINRLYNNKNGKGLLDNKVHYKHYSIGSTIGDVRNMAGHSKESKTMERWKLTKNASQAYLFLVLSSIRSIYSYIKKDEYLF